MFRSVPAAATRSFLILTALAALLVVPLDPPLDAQGTPPSVVDPNLSVREVITGLNQPTTMAFLGPTHFLILEKATGRVLNVRDGAVQNVAIDLAVNSASERGLLGMALHPHFPGNPGVYLYWTESSTGNDSNQLADVNLLANRVDRFEWNGTTLKQGASIIQLRAFQADPGQPLRGNHNGGVIKFGPDGKLYIVIGDEGRRGWLQNLACGPTATCPGPIVADDQFGGPKPDNAHLTGVILRLNDDGSTPVDNPLSPTGLSVTAEEAANIRKIFAYGLRNTFGFDFDPRSGDLWLEQNGDDSFSEIDRVEPGMNGGWVQVMGPISRLAQYKQIETSPQFFGLQQIRWPPTNIADTAEQLAQRLVMLPGSHYSDPELSFKFEVAPAGIGFMNGRAIGPQYDGDLFVGGATPALEGGHIFHIQLTGNRRQTGVDDPRLEDRVVDNVAKNEITEGETLLFGRNFGVGTDIRTGPNGNLFVVSLSKGTVYEIFRNK
jgi:glucose/arabinose dehydrogenase